MFKKVKALRDAFRKATSPQQEAQIQKQLDCLKEKNPKKWGEAMLQCMKETQKEAQELQK